MRASRIEPRPGQESVWDYPRPPRLERVEETLRVQFAGETIAETQQGYRVLETSHPPVYYFPPIDVRREVLLPSTDYSLCEFKGMARYWNLEIDSKRSEKAAWTYPEPTKAFQRIKGFFAFYASRVDACWVGGERVQPQLGGFYGGWVTAKVVGPFKGGPGSQSW